MNPTVKIEQAFLQLEFALKLTTYIELGKVDKASLDAALVVELESGNIHFPGGAFHSYDDIILAAQNNFFLTFGFTAVVLDHVLSEAGFAADLPVSSPHRDLRALVYMIRCAFAHDMMHPRWKARGPFTRGLSVRLPSGPLLVDIKTLNLQPLDVDQIGGMARYLELRDEVKRIAVEA